MPESVTRRRARLYASIRQFFVERGVLEVFPPVLGTHTVSDPHIQSFRVDFNGDAGFLQTSPEFALKKLLVEELKPIYSLGPAFRAGEQGERHQVEFVMLEWYRLGFDHVALMQEVSELVDQILGAGTYQVCTYQEVVTAVPVEKLDRLPDDLTDAQRLDLTFALGCEALCGRWFVIDYPADQAVLAKTYVPADTQDNVPVAARFELVIDGLELANGYWELTDFEEHRLRFAQDLQHRADASKSSEQLQPDSKFLAAIEAGLPACAGVAMGVDRLMMLALEQTSIDDVLAFRR